MLPGFGLTMGFTLLYLCLLVLIPLGALVLEVVDDGLGRVLADSDRPAGRGLLQAELRGSLAGGGDQRRLRLHRGLGAGALHVSGQAVASTRWSICRLRLPTAVSGIALARCTRTDGWIGRWLHPLGIDVAYTRLGVAVALTFIGLPFVVRTLQPALEDLDPEIEEAAASLGAGRLADLPPRDPAARCCRPC